MLFLNVAHYSSLLSLVGFSDGATSAFVSTNSCLPARRLASSPLRRGDSPFILFLSNQSSDANTATELKKKPLTAQDILARARKAAGVVSEEDADSGPILLFEDSLLQDMRKCLLTLEKRVQKGPQSLTNQEIVDLEDASRRIIADMKMGQSKSKPSTVLQTSATLASSSTPQSNLKGKDLPKAEVVPMEKSLQQTQVVSKKDDVEDIYSPFSVMPQSSQYVQRAYEQPLQAEAQALVDSFIQSTKSNVDDNESDDGPKYDGRGGFGMAKGTRNTYFIPGMDEMSPEEYREALQRSVSDRQKLRKQRLTTGNLSSNNYLDSLAKK